MAALWPNTRTRASGFGTCAFERHLRSCLRHSRDTRSGTCRKCSGSVPTTTPNLRPPGRRCLRPARPPLTQAGESWAKATTGSRRIGPWTTRSLSSASMAPVPRTSSGPPCMSLEHGRISSPCGRRREASRPEPPTEQAAGCFGARVRGAAGRDRRHRGNARISSCPHTPRPGHLRCDDSVARFREAEGTLQLLLGPEVGEGLSL